MSIKCQIMEHSKKKKHDFCVKYFYNEKEIISLKIHTNTNI